MDFCAQDLPPGWGEAPWESSAVADWAEARASEILALAPFLAGLNVAAFRIAALPAEASPADARTFAQALLVADWACYRPPLFTAAARVEPERLRQVVAAFSSGFRLLMAPDLKGEGWIPVGYTGWHPVEQAVFERLLTAPETLQGRGAIRPVPVGPEGAPRLAYLFNISLVESLQGKGLGRVLLAELERDWDAFWDKGTPRGLALVAVGAEPEKLAGRWGLSKRDPLIHDGESEPVYGRKADQAFETWPLRRTSLGMAARISALQSE